MKYTLHNRMQYRLDVWRVDFNLFSPTQVWQLTGDRLAGPTIPAKIFRRGLNEASYVRGLYELWDIILNSNPGLIIVSDVHPCSPALLQ
eukprot:COSAG05_NODE_7946_length_753_cov_0.943425_2_plen_89_part_00